MTEPASTSPRASRALPFLALVAAIHLFVAWPGANDRGVIAEEVQPYLHHYPKVLDLQADHVEFLPPNDNVDLRRAADERRPVSPRWVGTNQWPEVAYHGTNRVWPVFVRGHQTAIGTYWGIALEKVLGGGIAGVRRANVLMGLGALLLSWLLGRRLGLSRTWSTAAAIGCALCPALWFFCRTGYAYELASRVCMLLTLVVASPLEKLQPKRMALVGVAFAAAILCRATIATTLAPALILMLVHPRRWSGLKPLVGTLGIGGGLPVGFALVSVLLLPFFHGTTPAAALPIGDLAARTLNAPMFLLVQLGFLVDARMILSPLVDGGADVPLNVVAILIGAAVTIAAFVRFWQGRAGEAERLYLAGLLGNSLLGAWLYSNPREFQLGMALEPLFVLALVQQITLWTNEKTRLGVAIAAALLVARSATLQSLSSSESRTNNPMLSGGAQQSLVRMLQNEKVRGDELITTAYDHVGVIEVWTNETIRPIHAWRLLMAGGVSQDKLVSQWNRILDTHPACRVLITRGVNLYAGSFTNHEAVDEALKQATTARGISIVRRDVIGGNTNEPVFELYTLSPCGGVKR